MITYTETGQMYLSFMYLSEYGNCIKTWLKTPSVRVFFLRPNKGHRGHDPPPLEIFMQNTKKKVGLRHPIWRVQPKSHSRVTKPRSGDPNWMALDMWPITRRYASHKGWSGHWTWLCYHSKNTPTLGAWTQPANTSIHPLKQTLIHSSVTSPAVMWTHPL